MSGRKVYGWQVDGKWFLSIFPNVAGRPSNKYETQNEVIQEAERRGMSLEWLP